MELLISMGNTNKLPKKHREKIILSIIRNPFSRIVSSYFFKWWQNNLPTDKKSILKFYPNFPDLSFDEYYKYYTQFYSINHLHGIIPKIEIGTLSLFFIQFFAKNPDILLSEIDEDYFDNSLQIKDFNHINFIHQENLRLELKEFLIANGIKDKDIQLIDKKEDVNKSQYPSNINHFMDMYTDIMTGTVLKNERLLFKLFPEYLP